MIRRILVPLDGSTAAEAVLPYVERIATATSARVSLLVGVDKPRDWGEDTAGDLKGERHEAESYLRRLQARLTSATGNDVEVEVVASEPAAAILAASERQKPDLIAMTTHGRSGVARWVLGSVAAKVLHATKTPLLVVRPRPNGKQGDAPNLTKILVPLDGSELSASALPFVAGLAKPLGASVVLFQSVFEPVMTYRGAEVVFDDTVLREMEASARKALTLAADDLSAQGVRADVVATIGNAIDGIVCDRRAAVGKLRALTVGPQRGKAQISL